MFTISHSFKKGLRPHIHCDGKKSTFVYSLRLIKAVCWGESGDFIGFKHLIVYRKKFVMYKALAHIAKGEGSLSWQ
jgi:hypothetical protein